MDLPVHPTQCTSAKSPSSSSNCSSYKDERECPKGGWFSTPFISGSASLGPENGLASARPSLSSVISVRSTSSDIPASKIPSSSTQDHLHQAESHRTDSPHHHEKNTSQEGQKRVSPLSSSVTVSSACPTSPFFITALASYENESENSECDVHGSSLPRTEGRSPAHTCFRPTSSIQASNPPAPPPPHQQESAGDEAEKRSSLTRLPERPSHGRNSSSSSSSMWDCLRFAMQSLEERERIPGVVPLHDEPSAITEPMCSSSLQDRKKDMNSIDRQISIVKRDGSSSSMSVTSSSSSVVIVVGDSEDEAEATPRNDHSTKKMSRVEGSGALHAPRNHCPRTRSGRRATPASHEEERDLASLTAPPTAADLRSMAARETELERQTILESLSAEQREVVNYVVHQRRNVFITGGAGTGKSFLLRALIRLLPNATTFVTATTGIAALQLGGSTLHSFAGCGIVQRGQQKRDVCRRLFHTAVQKWRRCKVLVIDEVSMLEREFFELLEYMARYTRKSAEPFGGIQLVFSGDFLQLPPVTSAKDFVFCFESRAWVRCNPHVCLLTQAFRQKDASFFQLLHEMRRGVVSGSSRAKLRALSSSTSVLFIRYAKRESPQDENRVSSNTSGPGESRTENGEHTPTIVKREERRGASSHRSGMMLADQHGRPLLITSDGSTFLRPKKAEVERENARFYTALRTPEYFYMGFHEGQGKFPHRDLPQLLQLRKGCRVMLTKNLDVSCGLVNGSCGTVTDFFDFRDSQVDASLSTFRRPDALRVCQAGSSGEGRGVPHTFLPVVTFDSTSGAPAPAQAQAPASASSSSSSSSSPTSPPRSWLQDVVIVPSEWTVTQGEEVISRSVQLPLIVAFAITVHKSQGMSLTSVDIDLAKSFEAGQAYVALSRCTDLARVRLHGFDPSVVLTNDAALAYYDAVEFMEMQRRQLEASEVGGEDSAARDKEGRSPVRRGGPGGPIRRRRRRVGPAPLPPCGYLCSPETAMEQDGESDEDDGNEEELEAEWNTWGETHSRARGERGEREEEEEEEERPGEEERGDHTEREGESVGKGKRFAQRVSSFPCPPPSSSSSSSSVFRSSISSTRREGPQNKSRIAINTLFPSSLPGGMDGKPVLKAYPPLHNEAERLDQLRRRIRQLLVLSSDLKTFVDAHALPFDSIRESRIVLDLESVFDFFQEPASGSSSSSVPRVCVSDAGFQLPASVSAVYNHCCVERHNMLRLPRVIWEHFFPPAVSPPLSSSHTPSGDSSPSSAIVEEHRGLISVWLQQLRSRMDLDVQRFPAETRQRGVDPTRLSQSVDPVLGVQCLSSGVPSSFVSLPPSCVTRYKGGAVNDASSQKNARRKDVLYFLEEDSIEVHPAWKRYASLLPLVQDQLVRQARGGRILPHDSKGKPVRARQAVQSCACPRHTAVEEMPKEKEEEEEEEGNHFYYHSSQLCSSTDIDTSSFRAVDDEYSRYTLNRRAEEVRHHAAILDYTLFLLLGPVSSRGGRTRQRADNSMSYKSGSDGKGVEESLKAGNNNNNNNNNNDNKNDDMDVGVTKKRRMECSAPCAAPMMESNNDVTEEEEEEEVMEEADNPMVVLCTASDALAATALAFGIPVTRIPSLHPTGWY